MNLEKQQTINPYQPPSADGLPPPLPNTSSYYVVGKLKFFVLFFATLSLYSIYWFYQQWSRWKLRTGENIWPAPRALFNIFFTHSLFKKIHKDAAEISSQPLSSLQLPATLFVTAQIAINVIDRLTGDDYLALSIAIIVLIFVFIAWCLWQAQSQANIASADKDGVQNSSFTLVNYVWIVFGSIFWILMILGAVVDATGYV